MKIDVFNKYLNGNVKYIITAHIAVSNDRIPDSRCITDRVRTKNAWRWSKGIIFEFLCNIRPFNIILSP